MKYCYSLNEETYSEPYSTRKEALQAATEDNNSSPEENRVTEIFTAEVDQKKFIGYVDLEVLWESVMSNADEHCGEASDGFPDIPKKAEDDLMDLIQQWAEKHSLDPEFYGVENIEKHNVSKL